MLRYSHGQGNWPGMRLDENMAIFPPVLLIRRNHIILKLAAAGATSPETAVTLAEAGVMNSNAFKRLTNYLVGRGVIQRTADGRYYK